jgi:hypothetical protein
MRSVLALMGIMCYGVTPASMESNDHCDQGCDLGCDQGCEKDVHLLQEGIEGNNRELNDEAEKESCHQGVSCQIGHEAFHWRFLVVLIIHQTLRVAQAPKPCINLGWSNPIALCCM